MNKTNLTRISLPKTRILTKRGSEYLLPKNGILFRIFQSKSEYILITTGYPDIPEKGISNPVKISVLSCFHDKSTLLQLLYYLTFMSSESFDKLHLPIILEYNNRDVKLKRNDHLEIRGE